jgi:hypothetical protein
MKTAIFAVALMMGGAAIAQDSPDQNMAKPEADVTISDSTVPMATPTSPVSMPGNTDPELDARGIPVISDPATVPAGFNMTPGVGGPLVDASSPPPSEPATETYPPCTREITDNCVQTYERGRSPQ